MFNLLYNWRTVRFLGPLKWALFIRVLAVLASSKHETKKRENNGHHQLKTFKQIVVWSSTTGKDKRGRISHPVAPIIENLWFQMPCRALWVTFQKQPAVLFWKTHRLTNGAVVLLDSVQPSFSILPATVWTRTKGIKTICIQSPCSNELPALQYVSTLETWRQNNSRRRPELPPLLAQQRVELDFAVYKARPTNLRKLLHQPTNQPTNNSSSAKHFTFAALLLAWRWRVSVHGVVLRINGVVELLLEQRRRALHHVVDVDRFGHAGGGHDVQRRQSRFSRWRHPVQLAVTVPLLFFGAVALTGQKSSFRGGGRNDFWQPAFRFGTLATVLREPSNSPSDANPFCDHFLRNCLQTNWSHKWFNDFKKLTEILSKLREFKWNKQEWHFLESFSQTSPHYSKPEVAKNRGRRTWSFIGFRWTPSRMLGSSIVRRRMSCFFGICEIRDWPWVLILSREETDFANNSGANAWRVRTECNWHKKQVCLLYEELLQMFN